ncbi:hypothetical protein DVH05_022755 [Phytophthora capsici]|nr:hypothetical protein DVH05_022755 [Phytophthora capsici]
MPFQEILANSSHLRIRLQHLKHSPISFTMLKQLTTTLMLTLMFMLVLDPASAHAASPSFQLLRADGRQLEVQSANSSANATNPLYEYNTSIKGCKGIQYFFFWSCCGWNSC